MVYQCLSGYNTTKGSQWFVDLRAKLEKYDGFLIPHLGLCMTPGDPNVHDVAIGKYDLAIAQMANGISLLGRPIFIRIGYEFNGQWNNYTSVDFVSAWKRIERKLRAAGVRESVALVWDYSCDAAPARLDYMPYYPGDEVVDWWGVNIFSGPSAPTSTCVSGFIGAAEKQGFPVMLGESTPRFLGAQDGTPDSLCVNNKGRCLAVLGGGKTAGTALVAFDCEGGPNQSWRLTLEGLLVNGDGMCASALAASVAPTIATRASPGPGTKIVLRSCEGGGNSRRWRFIAGAGTGGAGNLQNVASSVGAGGAGAAAGVGQCLAVNPKDHSIVLWDCGFGPDNSDKEWYKVKRKKATAKTPITHTHTRKER
jgi:hypothetical protein